MCIDFLKAFVEVTHRKLTANVQNMQSPEISGRMHNKMIENRELDQLKMRNEII